MQIPDPTTPPHLNTQPPPATTASALTTAPAKITLACSRGGALHLDSAEAEHFIASSLEDALDLLSMARAYLPEDDISQHPRIGTVAVARTRIQEALDVFKKLQERPEKTA